MGKDMKRRDFLKGAGLTAGAAPFVNIAEAAGGQSRRPPNILLIISDEHNAEVGGFAADGRARTPNLDRLAARGCTFENAYTNSPLCVPSRLSLISGKYIHRVGAWSNNTWLPSDDYPSIARVMSAAGYDSLLCGKMHYDRTRRYGFTEIGGNMNRHRKTGRGGRRNADDLSPRPGISNRFDNFHTGDSSGVLGHDRSVTEGVTKFLRERRARDNPFFLIAGYLAPHFPLIVPERYYRHFEGEIPMPHIPPGHLDSQPLNYKHLRIGFNVENTPDEIVRRGRELYYGLTEWVDAEIGKVLSALYGSEVAENTVVIYTTDHGEDMGEHGLWWKNCMYEHAARVPLVVSWPKRWKGPQRRTEVCSLVDVVQTIAELGGGETPPDWDGDSLCPLLDDPRAGWKDFAVSQYYAHNIASGFAMLRQGRYKYVYHSPPDDDHDADRELYDLHTDSGEFNNLATEEAYADRVASMHEALVDELGESPDRTEQRCLEDYRKGYDRG